MGFNITNNLVMLISAFFECLVHGTVLQIKSKCMVHVWAFYKTEINKFLPN